MVNKMNKEFPRILTLLRKENGLSQKQVASDLDISQGLLSHYENGKRECSLDLLVKIAKYFDVTCDYLLGRTCMPKSYKRNVKITPNNKRISNALSEQMKKMSQVLEIFHSMLESYKSPELRKMTKIIFLSARITFFLHLHCFPQPLTESWKE